MNNLDIISILLLASPFVLSPSTAPGSTNVLDAFDVPSLNMYTSGASNVVPTINLDAFDVE